MWRVFAPLSRVHMPQKIQSLLIIDRMGVLSSVCNSVMTNIYQFTKFNIYSVLNAVKTKVKLDIALKTIF